MQKYFTDVENKVRVLYSIAQEARKRGLDPLSIVEIPLARSLGERVTMLVSVRYPQTNSQNISDRINELEKEHGKLNVLVALIIADEIASEKFCKFKNKLEAIDAAIRVGLAYVTLGIVSSPLEGLTDLFLRKNREGEYFSLFYSGPIRSAGGTAAAFSVVLADYLREKHGFTKYDPRDEEVKRAVTEIYDYHERVTNLQYLPSEKEIEIIASNLPVQIGGEPSEDKEVSNYKDLERIETNLIRSGFCLVMAEGIAQKAAKLLKIIKEIQKTFPSSLTSWNFLEQVIKLQKKDVGEKKLVSTTFMHDIVAGRPILTHPSRSGGFMLRYGRTRTSGYSAVAIHPATMVLLMDSIALGTQFRTERPGKSAAIVSCDSIEAPLIRLEDGSVKRIKTSEEAKKFKNSLSEIIYLGDILISYGDFFNRNHVLMPSGYREEYWFAELQEKIKEKREDKKILSEFKNKNISIEEAIELSKKFDIPLHPKFIYFWSQISYEDFKKLLSWLTKGKFTENKLILPFYNEKDAEAKKILEILGVEHLVTTENIVIENALPFLLNLGLEESFEKINEIENISEDKTTLEIVNSFSNFKICDKAGTFIGSRMGRPEKAKLRKLTGSPNVLFPVGDEGGRLRSVQKACETTGVKADFPIFYCEKCNKETIHFICEDCNGETTKMHHCGECGRDFKTEVCPAHGPAKSFSARRINIKHYLLAAAKKLNLQKEEIPPLIKGVKGTSSLDHTPEHIAKGILRAIFNLNVNKDGTIRYDATELPITHFKAKEINTDIEKLKELGYTYDTHGNELENSEQILEIKPHDVILPACPNSPEENADDVFFNLANFIDNLLVRFYDLKPFYGLRSKDDLTGHLVACIAPHNSAAVVGRIIGFSKMQALLASPFMHAAMRRDADGDEAAVMLLLDVLLNFSRQYLPAHRGATQDAPLILNARLRAGEVDDMVFDMETTKEFPLEFHRATETYQPPWTIKIPQVKDKIRDGDAAFKDMFYTFETSDINEGVTCSSYKTLATMQEKMQRQIDIVEKIRAVDAADVARLVIERHLIRDIRGNLRKFSMQQFRCSKCNEKYRRPPLTGACLKCQGNIIFTINEGGIVKYLEPAIQLANKYPIPQYIKQSLELTKRYIESIFGAEKEKQSALKQWFC